MENELEVLLNDAVILERGVDALSTEDENFERPRPLAITSDDSIDEVRGKVRALALEISDYYDNLSKSDKELRSYWTDTRKLEEQARRYNPPSPRKIWNTNHSYRVNNSIRDLENIDRVCEHFAPFMKDPEAQQAFSFNKYRSEDPPQQNAWTTKLMGIGSYCLGILGIGCIAASPFVREEFMQKNMVHSGYALIALGILGLGLTKDQQLEDNHPSIVKMHQNLQHRAKEADRAITLIRKYST
tara:strand:- start:1726 stop:2454 length:729 start_codon:yes stop_codon:yes gene_type:complete